MKSFKDYLDQYKNITETEKSTERPKTLGESLGGYFETYKQRKAASDADPDAVINKINAERAERKRKATEQAATDAAIKYDDWSTRYNSFVTSYTEAAGKYTTADKLAELEAERVKLVEDGDDLIKRFSNPNFDQNVSRPLVEGITSMLGSFDEAHSKNADSQAAMAEFNNAGKDKFKVLKRQAVDAANSPKKNTIDKSLVDLKNFYSQYSSEEEYKKASKINEAYEDFRKKIELALKRGGVDNNSRLDSIRKDINDKYAADNELEVRDGVNALVDQQIFTHKMAQYEGKSVSDIFNDAVKKYDPSAEKWDELENALQVIVASGDTAKYDEAVEALEGITNKRRSKEDRSLDKFSDEFAKLYEERADLLAGGGYTVKNSDGTFSAKYNWAYKGADGQWHIDSSKADARLKEIEGKIGAYESQLKEAAEYLSLAKYDLYRENDDFEEKSKYKSTANGKEPVLVDGQYTQTGYDDIEYDAINGNEDARTKIWSLQGGGTTLIGGTSNYKYTMEPEELEMYNYLYRTGDREAAEEYIRVLSIAAGGLNYRYRKEREATAKKIASEDPVGSSIMSVVLSPVKAYESMAMLGDYIADAELDPDAGYHSFSYTDSAIKKTVSSNFGPVGSYAYNIGMSIADSMYNMAICGGNPILMKAMIGAKSLPTEVVAAKDRGLSDEQALSLGILNSAAEVLTESFEIEGLLNKAWKNEKWLAYSTKNALTEAFGEGTSSFASVVNDIMVSKDKSQWAQAIQAYKDAGENDSDAFRKAFVDQALAIGLDSFAGALSGGIHSTIYYTPTAIANKLSGKTSDTGNTVNLPEKQNNVEVKAEPESVVPTPGDVSLEVDGSELSGNVDVSADELSGDDVQQGDAEKDATSSDEATVAEGQAQKGEVQSSESAPVQNDVDGVEAESGAANELGEVQVPSVVTEEQNSTAERNEAGEDILPSSTATQAVSGDTSSTTGDSADESASASVQAAEVRTVEEIDSLAELQVLSREGKTRVLAESTDSPVSITITEENGKTWYTLNLNGMAQKKTLDVKSAVSLYNDAAFEYNADHAELNGEDYIDDDDFGYESDRWEKDNNTSSTTDEVGGPPSPAGEGLSGSIPSNYSSADRSEDRIQFSLMNTETFADNVNEVINMSDEDALRNKAEDRYISIMKNTPDVILNNVEGAENREIIISFESLYLETRESGVLSGNYHGMGADIISALPEYISNPDAIVRMSSGRLNLFATLPNGKKKNRVISIELSTVKDINRNYDKYHLVITIFQAGDSYITNDILAYGVKVEYEKEGLAQVNRQLRESLEIINERPSDNSIPDFTGKSNTTVKKSSKRHFSVQARIAEMEGKVDAETVERARAESNLTVKTGILAGVSEKNIRMAREIGNAVERKIVFYNDATTVNGKMEHGYYAGNGILFVNAAAGDVVRNTVAHELTHSIEGTAAYDKLASFIDLKLKREGASLDAWAQTERELYKQSGVELTREEARKEAVARFVEQRLLTDEATIKELANIRRSVAQRFYRFFNGILAKLKNKKASEWMQLAEMRDLYAEALGQSKEVIRNEQGSKQRSVGGVDGAKEKDYNNKNYTLKEINDEQNDSNSGWKRNGKADSGRKTTASNGDIQRAQRDRNKSGIFEGRSGETVHSQGDGTRLDNEGKPVTANNIEALRNSSVVDDTGHLIALYHYTTDAKFTTFARGDVGFHFGSKEQAESRKRSKNIFGGRYFRAYLNIANPITINIDLMSWKANAFGLKLWSMGIISDSEFNTIKELCKQGYDYNSPASVKLRELLSVKGYDGLKYPNEYEGDGYSYAAFYPEQIITTDIYDAETEWGNVVEPKIQHSIGPAPRTSGDLSNTDRKYLDAVKKGDVEAAHKMVEEAAKAAGYTKLFYHGSSKGSGITVFRDWGYFTENKAYAERYAKRDDPGALYSTYVKIDKPFDTRNSAERRIFESIRDEYGTSPIQNSGLPDWTDGYDISDYIDENGLDYDCIVLDEGGDMVNGKPVSRGPSYVIRKSNQIKSADVITYDDDGNIIPISERFKEDNPDIRYSIGPAPDAESVQIEENEPTFKVDVLPVKAQRYAKHTESTFLRDISGSIGISRFGDRRSVKASIRALTEEYLTSGSISQETRAEAFEAIYNDAIVIDDAVYKEYSHIKKYLNTTKFYLSESERSDLGDYEFFRKKNMGTITLVGKGGLNVDSAYAELREMAPELFPASIVNPSAQIAHMAQVARDLRKVEMSLDDFHGPDAENKRYWARNDFEAQVNALCSELQKVKRYADDRMKTEDYSDLDSITPEVIRDAYNGMKDARRNYERVAAKHLLTNYDNMQVGRILRGEITVKELDPKRVNVAGVVAVAEAKADYEVRKKFIDEYKVRRKAALNAHVDKFLANVNGWKDKSSGLAYARETMERNILDIVPDPELAQEIVDEFFTPVHTDQAKATKMKNNYRDRVRALKLKQKAMKGDIVSESYAVQLYGEASDNMRIIAESKGRIEVRDGKTYDEWKAVIDELWVSSPSLDKAKIESAVKEFRAIYDELLEQMNEVRVRNGYEPISYRSGYFPHFQPGETGLLATIGKAFGIDGDVTALPTTINGMTHVFRPGIQWFGAAQERLGFDTAYDAVEGFDKYIEGAADIIFQTDNIQKLRALSNRIRYQASDEGIKRRVDAAMANDTLTESDKQALVDSIYKEGKFSLSNFVVNLDEYVNLLANKKSHADRQMEQDFGRRSYNVMKKVMGRVAANMVAINPGSWLTNFIPLTQGWSQVSSANMLNGMQETLAAMYKDDGIIERSAFLTNRKGSDPIVKSWSEAASGTLSSPMEFIDQFVAGSLVRARYRQNLQQGMSEAAAMADADAFTAGVMADRSKGSMPTLFSRTNPATKIFTQFQLEVNNQLSYLFKDMPRAAHQRDKWGRALAMMLFKFFLGAYIYNELYEYLIGRRPALDVIGIANETVGDFTGKQLLPDMFGGDVSFDTEKKGSWEAVAALFGNVVQELPFVGGLLDGGRVPISSALPDWENLGKAIFNDKWSAKKRWSTGIKEVLSSASNVALPFGGGQLKKVIQGLDAIRRGGSYTVDSEGNDILQYPVFNDDAGDYISNGLRAILFGKTSLAKGREWVESGFKSFSAKQTEVYKGMLDNGVKAEDAYNVLTEIAGVKTESDKRAILRDSGVSGEGKFVVYYTMFASDKEAALMARLQNDGAESAEIVSVLMGIKDAGDLRGAEASNAKRNAIAGSSLTDDQKKRIYRDRLSDSHDEKIEALEGAGLSFDDFLEVQSAYTTLKEEQETATGQAFEFSMWVDENYSGEQASMIRENFKYYNQVPADAGVYDDFSGAGVSSEAASKLHVAFSELKPENGKDDVSRVQKYRAIIDCKLSDADTSAAIDEIMTSTDRERYGVAKKYGFSIVEFVEFKEAIAAGDADGNGSIKQDEATAALKKMKLSNEERAVLWQLADKWKGKNNPFNVSTGEKVYAALYGD